MSDYRKLEDVRRGDKVIIRNNKDKEENGIVNKTLTKVEYNFNGIKVELENGHIGKVTKTLSKYFEVTEIGNLEKEFYDHVKLDESETLEFKGSLSADLTEYEKNKTLKPNEKVKKSIAKTIAAFANNRGGILYIGVRDTTKEIIGLKRDLELFKKNRNSEFLFNLNTILDKQLGRYDHKTCITVKRVLHLQSGDVCVIKVKPSKTPIIFIAAKTPELYVRKGDCSEPYVNIQAICDHWCEHLCKLNT